MTRALTVKQRKFVKHYVESSFEGTTQDPVFADQEGSPVVLRK